MSYKNNKQKVGRMKHPLGHLLILACSQRKNLSKSPVPAIHLYDGVNFRVLRKTLLERGWATGLQVKIISAKYGLIDATSLIEPYDLRLDKNKAENINKRTLAQLKKIPVPFSIFINLGKDYLPAIKGIENIFPNSKIKYANGAIGLKMKEMKTWLNKLNCRTASVKFLPNRRKSYLYFFPDWDDFIYEPFTTIESEYFKGKKTFTYEACKGKIPFNGILLSLSHIRAGKGALHRYGNNGDNRIRLRRRLRIPKHILLFGDCGAFSYSSESNPPFSPENAADLYHKFGFDIGASVDHIPLPEISVSQRDGSLKKKTLTINARRQRMYLTRDYAERFISYCKEKRYKFVPLGVIQGISTRSYINRLHEYLNMGYRHIAIGGLVPRTDNDILEIVCAVRNAIQERTRMLKENIWLHLFGILRPKLQPIFKELGVSSFDSASYFRKAWLRSDQNYLSYDGSKWYGTIRIPISNSKTMLEAADALGIRNSHLIEMEHECLNAINMFEGNPDDKYRILNSIDRYGPILKRKSEDNHFSHKHKLLLDDRPWEKCNCPFCKSTGINIIVFRGASRNKRRGLHNTWVFYHKVLHGNAIPTSYSGNV